MSITDICKTFQEFWDILKKEISDKKNSSFVKGGLGSFFIKFGHTILGMVSVIILARILGAESFGIYSYIFAIISIMAIPTKLGLPNLLVRYMAEYQVKEQWSRIKGLLRASNFVVAIVSIVLIGGSLLFIQWGVIKFEENKLNTFYWGLALLPVIALGAIRGASLRGLRHIVLGLAPERVVKHILLIGLLLGANWWLVKSSVSSEMAMMIRFVAALWAYLLGAYWLFKKLPTEVKKTEPDYQIKEWAKVALPFLLNGGMQVVNSRIDIVLLGWFGTAEQVGIYEVAWKGAALVSFGLGALNLMLGPYFSRYYHSNQLKRLQKIATISVVINCVIGLLVIIVFFLFGEKILEIIFGTEFTVGYVTLVILCFAHFVSVAAGSVAMLLNMTGHESKVLAGLTIAAASNIVLNLILIPRYGMEGAAIASICTFMIWNVFLVIVAIREIDVNPSVTSIIRFVR
jgi:O-antigen/teichoic acid export membrane protein